MAAQTGGPQRRLSFSSSEGFSLRSWEGRLVLETGWFSMAMKQAGSFRESTSCFWRDFGSPWISTGFLVQMGNFLGDENNHPRHSKLKKACSRLPMLCFCLNHG